MSKTTTRRIRNPRRPRTALSAIADTRHHRTRAINVDEPIVVLGVEVFISAQIIQHVAIPFHTDIPLSEWTRDLFLRAARAASGALPRTEALKMECGLGGWRRTSEHWFG